MHIMSLTFNNAKIVNNFNSASQSQVKYRLKSLSSDQVSFKETPNEVKTTIDKKVTDKILKLFEQHQSNNLELVNPNNEMVYNIKFIPTQGNLYLNEFKYTPKGIQKFDSAIVNKYYYFDENEAKRLFSETFQSNFTILDIGRVSNILFNGSPGVSSKFDDPSTLQYTEDALTKILSGIDSQDLQVFNGRIASTEKHYDDFNKINDKKYHFAKAYNVCLQRSGLSPSYREISETIDGFRTFKSKGSEAQQKKLERARLATLSDEIKYKFALDKQKSQKKPEKAIVYKFEPKKTE